MSSPMTNFVSNLFFKELKQYNGSNFRALHSADVQRMSPEILKAFSSVPTRYFIFCEKHPEIAELDKRILYYKLKIDMIGRFLANYPDTNPDDLVAFQTELSIYEKSAKGDDNAESA